jgi:HlyD family secretion protein
MSAKKNITTKEEGASAYNVNRSKKRRPKKRLIVILAIISVVLAIIIASGLSGKKQIPAHVSTGTAEIMDLCQDVHVNGIVNGSDSADVVSSLDCKVSSILAREGDVVKKGQVLAVLDGKTLEGDYKKALKAFEESRFNYEASLTLYNEGAISKAEYMRAKTAYENDQITLNSFNISDSINIRAPISGTVTRVNTSLGRNANSTDDNKPMFVIVDLDKLRMDVKISEYDIGKIKTGQSVTITSDMLGEDSVEGTVSRISPTGELLDPASKEMVIPVQIDINDAEMRLIAGVSARAKIHIESRTGVMAVPIDSVLEDPDTGESFVFIADGALAKKVIIEPGIEGEFHLEVLSGSLSSGDKVILNPGFDLFDNPSITL